jgi:hypothetical protein
MLEKPDKINSTFIHSIKEGNGFITFSGNNTASTDGKEQKSTTGTHQPNIGDKPGVNT